MYLLGLLYAGLGILVAALIAPIATLDQLFLDPDTYSILGSIGNLFGRGDFLLAFLITAFSVVFPILKYVLLIQLVLSSGDQNGMRKRLRLLRFLGKWSMLDVFVTVISFGAANLGVLSQVQIHWGIYLYAAGVTLSMCVAMSLSWSVSQARERSQSAERHGVLETLLLLITFSCFLSGIAMPLVEIQKWLFWESQYSLLSALQHLLVSGEYLMPILLLVFVVLLPLARFILMLLVRSNLLTPQSIGRLGEFLEEWAMFDVYMLAMLLVVIKLSDSATVNLQAGFWLLGVAAALNLAENLRGRWSQKASSN
jgi:paraquat-inducible protein A